MIVARYSSIEILGVKTPGSRLFALFAFFSMSMHGQWLNFRTPGTPRTPDGKPDLAAPAPRTADGKPDLSGVWMHETSSVADIKRVLRLVERYRRRDFGHLDVETTIDDPEMYTRPFTIKVPHDLLPHSDVFESFCENEKDGAHLDKK